MSWYLNWRWMKWSISIFFKVNLFVAKKVNLSFENIGQHYNTMYLKFLIIYLWICGASEFQSNDRFFIVNNPNPHVKINKFIYEEYFVGREVFSLLWYEIRWDQFWFVHQFVAYHTLVSNKIQLNFKIFFSWKTSNEEFEFVYR
jgi:hypothetical protein